jgi:hypothetical protein
VAENTHLACPANHVSKLVSPARFAKKPAAHAKADLADGHVLQPLGYARRLAFGQPLMAQALPIELPTPAQLRHSARAQVSLAWLGIPVAATGQLGLAAASAVATRLPGSS